MKMHLRRNGVVFCAVATLLLLTVGALRCSADEVTLTLTFPDSLGSAVGPYATVTINRTSTTTATVTFDSLSNGAAGGNTYLMGNASAADLNVNGIGVVTVSGLSGSNPLTGFTPAGIVLADGGSGSVDGFGTFDLTIDDNGSNSFLDSATEITFTLTRSSGSWTSASNVLTPDAKGYEAAIHTIDCKGTPCTSASTHSNVGFASTPEPRSMTLFGTGLLVMGFVLRRRNKQSRTA